MPYTRRPRMSTKARSYIKNVKKEFRSQARATFRRAYPARLTGSRINYQVAKAVSSAMNKVSENKIVALTNVNEALPSRIQALALATTKSFTLGSIPPTWAGVAGLQAVAGMEFPLGDTHSDRNGKYIYLQKTHATLDIEMFNSPDFAPPTEFRVLCVKARRSNNPSGTTNRFDLSLFLATNGNEFGSATAGINGTDLMVQPVNKKDWVCLSDRKFMLTNPQIQQDLSGSTINTFYAGKYPIMKRLIYNMPFNAKTEINATDNRPDDLDFNYVLVVYARTLGKDYLADNYECNLRGSTTFKDN